MTALLSASAMRFFFQRDPLTLSTVLLARRTRSIRDAVGTDPNFHNGLTHTASSATRLATRIRIAVASLATERLIKPVAKRCWEPRVSQTPHK